ncbi:MAG: serine/threonine-protein kinase [Phycisphaerae bacterium]
MAKTDTNANAASNPNAASAGAGLDSEVGKLVVEMGLATRDEVVTCQEQLKQASDPNQKTLTQALIEHGSITQRQANRIRAQLDDRRGSQIPGYQLLGKLGKGAMATVYKGKQISLDRSVAIKVLPKKMSENVDFVERFYKEGRAAAKLSHNNIVQAIDVGTTPDNFHYFVMELVEGKTLYDMMQPPPVGENHSFSEAEALAIGVQMADALAHSHKKGLIHRDVKPKNILLTKAGVAKLTDLGLARDKDDKRAAETEAGKAYGTPYYISPEQIRGEVDIDYRADIYGLGATLYHLVTGRPPFDGDTPSAVMHKHLREALIPPDHINEALTPGFSEVIEVAMAKDRAERYQTTEDMLEDLRAIQRGENPQNAHRMVDLEHLAHDLEAKSHTVDIDHTHAQQPDIWSHPAVITLIIVALISIVLNLFLAVT